MLKLKPIAALILGSTVLPACVTSAPKIEIVVRPHEEVHNSPGARMDQYELGRFYQSTGKLGLAMQAYAQALKVNSKHVEAGSALATLYSQQGRLAEAESMMRDVVAQSPGAAYLHNNLGYIHYLQGNHVAAIGEFRAALALDPKHEWARNNLALAEAGLSRDIAGNPEPAAGRAETTVKAFEVWNNAQTRDARLERNLEVALGLIPPPAKAVEPVAIPVDAPKPDVVALVMAPNATRAHEPKLPAEITRPLARTMERLPILERKLDVRSRQTAAVAPKKFRLEVSNGNGVDGFAKRVSVILNNQGIPVANLTNQLPYNQSTTEIQYKQGFEQEAQQILNTLRSHATVTQVDRQRYWTDLRVVLGKDITTHVTELETEKPAVVATAKSGAGPL